MESLYHLSDGQLIGLLNQDSEAAFTEVYRRYFDVLDRHAYKMTYGDDGSCDLVHDVFANLWVRRRELINISGSALKYYLYAATRNAVLNDLRRKRYLEKNQRDFARYASTRMTAPDQQLVDAQTQSALDKEIGGLPDRMREIFLLRRNEELSYAQIAEKLNLSKLTVKTQMHNAIYRLWKKFSTILIFLIIRTLN
ncbi:RNA polymerase sigma factor [Parapedobacter tibetensis]|uniref:RNA polymerase sigma factor n=1 Tax=Parapedobacter tibetensis TaxID=2972951 RepID=UPI00214D944C|nr:sigma-70 family RNA polymerase sigma factor [Parapedobacter tibetensis]